VCPSTKPCAATALALQQGAIKVVWFMVEPNVGNLKYRYPSTPHFIAHSLFFLTLLINMLVNE